MTKIIRKLWSCSIKIFCTFPTVNISKIDVWLVICIAKNLIWTTLKMIFSIFRFFCTLQIPDFQILSDHNKPYINGNIIYSAFRWCMNLNFVKLTLMTGFVPGSHMECIYLVSLGHRTCTTYTIIRIASTKIPQRLLVLLLMHTCQHISTVVPVTMHWLQSMLRHQKRDSGGCLYLKRKRSRWFTWNKALS